MSTLISTGKANHKIGKNMNESYIVHSLNLKPATTEVDGKTYNLCPFRTDGCTDACVGNNGHFSMLNGNAYKAQVRRTELYFRDPKQFYNELNLEIVKLKEKAKKKDAVLVLRLNAYSDINHGKQSRRYLGASIYKMHTDVIFYDYTKDRRKAERNCDFNYHLTYSHNENVNIDESLKLLEDGINVAIVFEKLPETYKGYKVFDGDQDDNRFLDPKNHIIGLKFKGSKAKLLKGIASGFVVPNC